MTDPLVEWLRGVLDEDERRAKAASEASPDWSYDGTSPKGPRVVVGPDTDDIWTRNINSSVWDCDDPEDGCEELAAHWEAEAEHMVDHDPAAVLADIAAKRAILDWCTEVIGDRDLTTVDQFGSLRQDPQALAVTLAAETVRLLAWADADRPGYRDEWRPVRSESTG